MTQAGITLIELMIVTVIMAIVATIGASLLGQAHGDYRRSRGYERDVVECRRTLAAIESDLRAARRLTPTATGFRLDRDDARVEYRLAAPELVRIDDGRVRTLARCVATIDVAVTGGLAHVELAIRRRTKSKPGRDAVLDSDVFLRNLASR